MAKGDQRDVREVIVHISPAWPRKQALAHILHHEVCGDGDGGDDLVSGERHELQVEACTERRVNRSGLDD